MKRILSGAAGLALLVFTIGFVASAAQADTFTQPVGEAGTVTFSTDGGVLAFVGAAPADGWTYTIDRQDDTHLEITFRDANGAEVEFEAELEDGTLDLQGTEDDDSSSTTEDTTGTTIDDSDDDESDDDEADDEFDDESDDDESEDEFDDEADDESDDDSGPGSIDDDDDDESDDDDSGQGSDDDEDDDEDGTTTTTVVTIP